MEFDTELIARLLGPLLSAIVAALIKHYSEARASVVAYLGHVSTFALAMQEGQPRIKIFMHSLVVRNAGRLPAKNLRIGHSVLPQNIYVHPAVEHSVITGVDGTGEILFPVLVAKEEVTISYLYVPPLTAGQIQSYVKSDEGLCKWVNVQPTVQPSKPLKIAAGLLMFVGASFLFYWVCKLAIYLLLL